MNLDVNLLPKSNKRLSAVDSFLLILIIVGVFLIVAIVGFYLPINNKTSLQNEIENRKQELIVVTAEAQEYTNLVDGLSIQNNKNSTINTLIDDYILQSSLLEDIESSLHNSITIRSISLTQSNINISGESNDYNNIAQSIVNLREKEYFLYGSFSSVELDSDDLYTFNMSINVGNPLTEEIIEEENIEDIEEEVDDNDEAE